MSFSWMEIFLMVGWLSVVSGAILENGKMSYQGYKIIRVHFDSATEAMEVLDHLLEKTNEIDVWECTPGVSKHLELIVGPKALGFLEEELRTLGLSWEITNNNLGSLVEKSDLENELEDERVKRRRRYRRDVVENDILGRYVNYTEYMGWMKKLADDYPDMVEVVKFGVTVELNDLFAMKISKKSPCPKPGILLDSMTHAREWITPATLVYVVHQLMNGYRTNDADSIYMLTHFDWYFVPIVNPDGYEYSHTSNRLWRKNRSNNAGSPCLGVDLNRNWDFGWGEGYTSRSPCSILFRGDEPASEQEVKFYSSYLLRMRSKINAYVSLHSFHQAVLTRWGYTENKHPQHDILVDVARRATEAMKVGGGETYLYGPPHEVLYAYSGGTADWISGRLNISLAFTIELRDTGFFGFLLPSNFTTPVGQETWSALKVIAMHVLEKANQDGIPCTLYGDQSFATKPKESSTTKSKESSTTKPKKSFTTKPTKFSTTKPTTSSTTPKTPLTTPSSTSPTSPTTPSTKPSRTTTEKNNPQTKTPRQNQEIGQLNVKVSHTKTSDSGALPSQESPEDESGFGKTVERDQEDEENDLSKYPDLVRTVLGGQAVYHSVNYVLHAAMFVVFLLATLYSH